MLHYTAMASCAEARERLCAPEHQVSAHWLIGVDGAADCLVDEASRAWHAGAGTWAGLEDINSHSIGIELDNPGDQPFSLPQIATLETVLRGAMQRWSIRPERVIAHSDMAPDRKSDPGPRFDWRALALSGLSVWPTTPRAGGAAQDFYPAALGFGYPDLGPDLVLRAFRLRFRPHALDRPGPDAQDAALAQDLARRFPARAAI